MVIFIVILFILLIGTGTYFVLNSKPVQKYTLLTEDEAKKTSLFF